MVWLGVLLALATSVSWAAGNVLTQRSGRRIGAPRAMLWSMVAGALLALPCAAIFDVRTAGLAPAVLAWLGVAGIAGVVAYVGLFVAFASEGLTVTVPIVSSWPVVAMTVAVALLGEATHGRQAAGAAAIVGGVVLVALPAGRSAATPGAAPARASGRALGAALGAALGFGIMIPAMGRVAPATGAFGATVVVFALGVALALGVGRIAGVSLAPPPRAAWGLVLATGAAETTGFVTVALARRFAPMTIIAPVASLASVLTVVYAWAVLKERPSPRVALGALVAGLGVAVLAS